MGQLSEIEVLDCLKSNLRLAAQSCDTLAVSPRKGPAYSALRDQLRLVEGSCRQIAYLRGGDARWLAIGMYMAKAHKFAGDWLRGIKQPNGARIKLAPGQIHPHFTKLASNLRAAYVKAEELRAHATNRIGPILPAPGPAPHRDTRPAGWSRSPGGLIVPRESLMNGTRI
jgi:hypothetical protein